VDCGAVRRWAHFLKEKKGLWAEVGPRLVEILAHECYLQKNFISDLHLLCIYL
jgi:hypothetical protein